MLQTPALMRFTAAVARAVATRFRSLGSWALMDVPPCASLDSARPASRGKVPERATSPRVGTSWRGPSSHADSVVERVMAVSADEVPRSTSAWPKS